MKRYLLGGFWLLICSACSQDIPSSANGPTAPSPTSAPATSSRLTTSGSSARVPLNYRAHLSGNEVIPPRDTQAQGEAIFQLNGDETALSYRVIVSNIENVTAAHLHLQLGGPTGPLVALLSGNVAPGGGRTDGVLATGTVTAATLIPPSSVLTFSALMAEIAAGHVYVDIPTNDGVSPPNTGPGDFPGGEVRGQLR